MPSSSAFVKKVRINSGIECIFDDSKGLQIVPGAHAAYSREKGVKKTYDTTINFRHFLLMNFIILLLCLNSKSNPSSIVPEDRQYSVNDKPRGKRDNKTDKDIYKNSLGF